MRAAYITADKVGTSTGGGLVTYNELQALSETADVVIALSADNISPSLFRQPDSVFLSDYFALDMVKKLPKFDLAHFYSGTFSHTVSWLKAHKTKITYTVPAHDRRTTVEEFQKLGIDYPYHHIKDDDLWAIFSGGYKEADVVIAPSTVAASFLFKEGCLDVRVVPHGCDIPPPEKVKDIPSEFKVGYLGQIGPDKGISYLLKAWEILNYPDAELLLAGAPREQFAQLIQSTANKGRFKIAGWLPDVADLYNQITVYCQPSVCLTPDTKICTFNGLKPIKDIKVGELVLTHKGQFKPVTKLYTRQFAGNLIKIDAFKYYEPIICTPEHPVFAIRRPPKKYKKGRIWEEQKPEWIAAKDIKKGDCLLSPILEQIFSSKDLEVSKGLAELIGWYVAEGSPLSNQAGIEFSLSGSELNVAQKIRDIVKVLFSLDATIKHKKRSVRVWNCSTTLGCLFPELCGEGARNKRLPRTLLLGDKDVLNVAVEAVIDGDGCRYSRTSTSNRHTSVTTSSEQLAHDLFWSLMRLGKRPSIQYLDLTGKSYKTAQYHVGFADKSPRRAVGNRSWFVDNYMACLVNNVSSVSYDGDVRNLEVQDDNSYVAGVFALHNCESFGIEILEAMSYGRPVIASKGAGASELIMGTGLVVPIRSPEEIAKAIDWFRKNPVSVQNMGKKAREDVVKFKWSTIREKYREIWREVLKDAATI